MAKELRKQEMADAVTAWAEQEGMTVSSNEKGFTLMPGDISIYVENGKLVCTSSDSALADTAKIAVSEKIAEAREDAPKSSNLAVRRQSGITSRSQAGSVPGSALSIVQQCASQLEPTYQVGKVTAPYARTVLTAAADAAISFEVRQYIHKPDYIEANVRAHLGDKYNDAVVSVFKQDFINSRAWEMVGKQAKFDNAIIDMDNPFLDNGMPNIRKDATVSIKLGGKDAIKTGYQKVNASLWLYQELMQAWIFQGRMCITKAKAKSAGELLLGTNPDTEVQEIGELEDENKERSMVEGFR